MRISASLLCASLSGLMACGDLDPHELDHPATALETTSAAISSVDCATAPRVRKNAKDLTDAERKEFVKALHTLKKRPSPYTPGLSWYDQFVAWHLTMFECDPHAHHHHHHSMATMGHGGPMFLPWHRELMLHFEAALCEVTGKPIGVPYWDWTDPASTAAVFGDELMGGDGDPEAGYVVTEGPFRANKWKLEVHPVGFPYALGASNAITRRFGTYPLASSLPTAADVAHALTLPAYDVHPFDVSSDTTVSFRNLIEGWINVPAVVCVDQGGLGVMLPLLGPDSSPAFHNAVHFWVAGLLGGTFEAPVVGTFGLSSSPNDPVFWLHHSQIDRLWAQWQALHPGVSYAPASGHPGANADDVMMPFAAIGVMTTPEDVEDITTLGYTYQ